MTTLDQLKPGQMAQIVRIEGFDGIASRLREMGFVPGQAVQFLRSAPLGDPLKCSVQGSRIAVRCGEARRVFIEPIAEPAFAS
ncbi:FeoA domain protein [Novipirellula galeiformis]|uniref:FeoA domain protein n=1 Tax=Novipirellula galeiformis TaxID=2528004 RepID=A0A5C6CU14_9BACT|nr:ferrous iron transport protein A [Novipirellula galeiformis]TWU26229.1 FeoA domain protein [Novipirellula galeiformis]